MLTVSSAGDLAQALRTAPQETVIALDAPLYRITESLALTRRLTLRGCDPENPPLLIFADGHCELSVTAAGCCLEHLALTATGHRGTALLRIAADACHLRALALLRSQGSGLRLEHCRDTEAQDLVAQDLGQEAVVALNCIGLNLSLHARDIGQRLATSAIRLIDCKNFNIEAAIARVSGSAVAIEEAESTQAPMAGAVTLRAQGMQRALSVLGRREVPASGLHARISARDWSDVAVLLSNAEKISVHVDMPAVGETPVVKINGGFGLRQATVMLAWPGARADVALPPGLVSGGGQAAHGNAIGMRQREFVEGVWPTSLLPETLHQRLQDAAGPAFLIYDHAGRCSLCGWEGRFRRLHPSERETLACGDCRASLRYRGQAEVICQRIGGDTSVTLADLVAAGTLDKLAIYEPGISGPLRPWLRQAGRYEQSVYDPDLPSGTRRADGLICQDLMATSFAPASFDLIVTSDIFEHIRKPFAAFAEIRRILKPGGLHVWTVPIGMPPPVETRPRVDTSGPEDRMLLPPVYHGSGAVGLSLVYTDFGRDIGARLAAIGLPTEGVRHVVGAPDHVVAVTFVSIRADMKTALI